MSRKSTTFTTTFLSLALGGMGLAATGCFSEADPVAMGDETDGMDEGDESGMDEGPGEDDGVDPPSTTGEPPDPTDGDSGDTGEPPDTGGGTEYEFDDSPPEDFVQVDRSGMPAVGSAVISDKDAYNVASPADDAAGMFVEQIVANVTGLHAALDDDLMAAGLVPCAVEACIGQAAPLVVPDTLKIDLNGEAGFPNGRLPSDPVIDVTLAVVLLDLSAPGQDPLTLVGLNPTENDVEFDADFPYFARPHE